MKFKNTKTGNILTVTNETAITLMCNSERYEEVVDMPVKKTAKKAAKKALEGTPEGNAE